MRAVYCRRADKTQQFTQEQTEGEAVFAVQSEESSDRWRELLKYCSDLYTNASAATVWDRNACSGGKTNNNQMIKYWVCIMMKAYRKS